MEERGAIIRLRNDVFRKLLQAVPNHRILPGKAIFSVKPPHKLKVRAVACGNFVPSSDLDQESLFASGVDTTTLRVILRIAALSGWEIVVTDVSTAFLYAPLQLAYTVIVRPPTIFVEAGACHPDDVASSESTLWAS